MLIDEKTNTDARILRTMESLRGAFTELIRKEGYDSITVGTLCRQASVCRVTFYNHFDDKQDYLRYYVTSAIDAFVDEVMKLPPECAHRDRIKKISGQIFRYLKSDGELIQLLHEAERSDEVARTLNGIVKKTITMSMKLKCRNMAQRDALASFYTSGLICMLHIWLSEFCQLSEKEFYGIVKRIMNSRFSDVIIAKNVKKYDGGEKA